MILPLSISSSVGFFGSYGAGSGSPVGWKFHELAPPDLKNSECLLHNPEFRFAG
jgi:hypothetical protein